MFVGQPTENIRASNPDRAKSMLIALFEVRRANRKGRRCVLPLAEDKSAATPRSL